MRATSSRARYAARCSGVLPWFRPSRPSPNDDPCGLTSAPADSTAVGQRVSATAPQASCAPQAQRSLTEPQQLRARAVASDSLRRGGQRGSVRGRDSVLRHRRRAVRNADLEPTRKMRVCSDLEGRIEANGAEEEEGRVEERLRAQDLPAGLRIDVHCNKALFSLPFARRAELHAGEESAPTAQCAASESV